jgi:hypothetical protein
MLARKWGGQGFSSPPSKCALTFVCPDSGLLFLQDADDLFLTEPATLLLSDGLYLISRTFLGNRSLLPIKLVAGPRNQTDEDAKVDATWTEGRDVRTHATNDLRSHFLVR